MATIRMMEAEVERVKDDIDDLGAKLNAFLLEDKIDTYDDSKKSIEVTTKARGLGFFAFTAISLK